MTTKLCLLWQNALTGQWYYVGDLILKDSGVYAFKYNASDEPKGLSEALKNGYHLHPTFPEIDKEYESSFLFSAFARRLPDRKRKDYVPVLAELGITQQSTDFELLAATGGRLNSDTYEFVNTYSAELLLHRSDQQQDNE
jgi:hypothetical protein